MSSTRILLKHDGIVYRFIRLEARPDGSLVVLIDRDPGIKNGSQIFKDGAWHPNNTQVGKVLPRGKFSCHTTGQINRYNGRDLRGKFFIEPLHLLTKASLIGFYSIPNPTRLNLYDDTIHGKNIDVISIIEIPSEISERITFALEIMPLNAPTPNTYFVKASYEIYAFIARLDNIAVPSELADHFIEGAPSTGEFENRQIGIPEAELGFHAAKNNGNDPIYRERNGVYVILTSVPMRIPPKLTIKFAIPELSAEQIFFQIDTQPTHKVQFWIKDKGGRNKTIDYRKQIISAFFDSEL